MKFDLKTPCKDCPFLIGSSTNKSLDEGRIRNIMWQKGRVFNGHKIWIICIRDSATKTI